MIEFLWGYGETSAFVFVAVCGTLWATRKRHAKRDKDDLPVDVPESYKVDEK